MIIDWINEGIAGIGAGLQALINLLPQSPFNYVLNVDNKFIQLINYVLPFSQAVAHLQAYVAAVVVYYAIRIILKWVKAAGN